MVKTEQRCIPPVIPLIVSGLLTLHACSSARVASPAGDYKRACRIMEKASGSGGPAAVSAYIEALEMLTKLREDHPSWNVSLVERRMDDCRRFIDVYTAATEKAAPGGMEEQPLEEPPLTRGGAPLGTPDGVTGADDMDPGELLDRAKWIAAAEGDIREREKGTYSSDGDDDLLAPPVITFREAKPGHARSYSDAAVEHYTRARELIERKDYNGAIGELREAVYLEGDYIEAFIALGEIYETVGEDGIAIEAYRSSLGIDDDTPDAHCGIGNIYVREGMSLERGNKMMEAWSKYQNAVLEYKRATWVDIGCAPAYYGIGVAYSRLGRHGDAAYYWKKTIEAAGKESEHGKRAMRNLAVTGLAP